ncbi:hypothetical protein GCM10010435_30660 [Winogradskya consettensis]|uniref:Uncharacterized protein n=1 Tax=Winogradskya consettensis TaxID=113560 RepID=A0A919SH17_9ACTN|nr:hypothetical protein [Actinoplanes consettensis]GIM70548.1 hypothetical protein Aco04nite_20840 [Actinoplanes consettensis]
MSRLGSVRIVSWTPTGVVQRRGFSGLLAFAALFVPNALLAAALNEVNGTLRYLGLLTCLAMLALWWRPLTALIHRLRGGIALERLHRKLRRLTSTSPGAGLIRGIRPGNWVVTKNQRTARGTPEQPEPHPRNEFRMCIARYDVNDHQSRLAFTDGTSMAWTATTQVLHQRFALPSIHGLTYSTADVPPDAAAVLNNLVRVIAAAPDSTTLAEARVHLEPHTDAALLHALRAGVVWGIVATGAAHTAYDMIGSVSLDHPGAGTVALRLTEAGRVWLACAPKTAGMTEPSTAQP